MPRFGEYPDSGPPRRNQSWARCGPALSAAGAESSRGGPPALGSSLGGRPVPETFDEPLVVVASDELGDHGPGLLQRLEAVEIEALLLQRPHEAFDDAIALGLAHV